MRLSLLPSGRSGRRLGVASLPSLHDVLWWLLAALIAALAAQLVWSIVTPVSPVGNWRPAGVKLMSQPARAALFAQIDPFNRAPATAVGAVTVTALPLTLYGTRTNMATGGGTAIIAGEDGIQKVYRTGEEISVGVVLAEVAFDHVTIDRGGAKEQLWLDQSKPAPDAAAVVPNPVAPVPAGSEASTALSAAAVKAGIGFGPKQVDGRIVGMVVASTGDGSAFRAAGFQTGDVITELGGTPVDEKFSPSMMMAALKPGASVTVTVKRGERSLPLALTIAP